MNFSDYENIFNNFSVPVSCCNTTNPLANETTCPDIVMDITNVTTELIYTEVHHWTIIVLLLDNIPLVYNMSNKCNIMSSNHMGILPRLLYCDLTTDGTFIGFVPSVHRICSVPITTQAIIATTRECQCMGASMLLCVHVISFPIPVT